MLSMLPMDVSVGRLPGPGIEGRPVEIVERKGVGHPDSVCDALAEQLSLALSRFYQERFGRILHHNVDKALLWGGVSRPRFGGGEVVSPCEIFLAGRAACHFRGVDVPVEELVVETGRRWLSQHLRALDPQRHVVFHSLVRPGSADLVELFLRQDRAGVRLSNDTSCGVGFAPLSELERIVLGVERGLHADGGRGHAPERGEDVKVMGVRRGERIQLTVACAFVDRHLRHLDDYLECKARAADLVRRIASGLTSRAVEVAVNTADDPAQGSVYLTVTGTSGEAGDDGEAGRGNRVNGLITPCRPMTMESVAGKNPITHVGKLYNLAACLCAEAVVEGVPEVREAECRLVSSIGRPVEEPLCADVRLGCTRGARLARLRAPVEAILREQLRQLRGVADELLRGDLGIDRWPLRGGPSKTLAREAKT
jgi:S-adenosylmethionine synthetase